MSSRLLMRAIDLIRKDGQLEPLMLDFLVPINNSLQQYPYTCHRQRGYWMVWVADTCRSWSNADLMRRMT